jgi:hypothetical protein
MSPRWRLHMAGDFARINPTGFAAMATVFLPKPLY